GNTRTEMFVKICGITNREDALAAVEAGARAIGFVFASFSPRVARVEEVEPWISEIPAGGGEGGGFGGGAGGVMEQIATQLALDVVQLHGAETPEQHPRGVRVWRAFRVSGASAEVPEYPAEAILIDGPQYDWARAGHISKPMILAGGLTPENVE